MQDHAQQPRTGRAAAQGAVAAMAMSGLRVVTTALGLVVQPPPEEIMREEAPRLVGRLPVPWRTVVKELAHWTYGAAGGAVYARLPGWVHRRRWAGVAYGLLVWGAFELVLAPLLDLPHTRERRVREAFALAGDHVLYGVILGQVEHHSGARD